MEALNNSKVILSIVIPVFNEENNLRLLYKRLTETMRKTKKGYEIIFVDDGSKDNSFGVLGEIRRLDNNVKVVRFTRNFGQHAALRAGFLECRGEATIFMDADLQTAPEDILKLINEHRKGREIVWGLRENRKDPIFRKFLSTVFLKAIDRLVEESIFRNVSSFVLYDKKVVQALNRHIGSARFLTGWPSKLGFNNASSIRIGHEKRLHGKSKYNYKRLYNLFVEILSAFSERPLHLVCFLGIMISTINCLVGVAFVIKKFVIGDVVEGFSSLFVFFNIASGIEIFFVGVVGLYLAKIYHSLISAPLYVIRESLP
jgi:glycosyltransferase involved in cell wall biosynthesis